MKWLWKLLIDQRGEDGADEAPADAGTASDAGVDAGTDAPGQAGEAPVGDQAPQPKFGEFGDDPEQAATKLMELYQKTQGEFNNFKTKSGMTERNLGSLRKALESSGIRAVESEDGQLRLEAIQKAERKTRFSDEHKSMFEPKVLEGIRNLVQDIFDEQYEGRERTTTEQKQKMQQFLSEKNEVESLMDSHFPMLNPKYQNGKPTNENFNQAFYDKATEIWINDYNKNPLKQLSAALRAAKELNIVPQMVQAAKKEGVQIGKAGKKILAPVSGSGTGTGSKIGSRKLSQAEYLALPSDQRVEYDKAVINQRK